MCYRMFAGEVRRFIKVLIIPRHFFLYKAYFQMYNDPRYDD